MVDNLSTEEKIQNLLEEARNFSYPEDGPGIKKRYRDTSLTLFKESQEDGPRNYLSFGSRRSSTVSQYGNTPIVIRRSRSSNGGLAMVAEQVSSLKGRSSRSDYALVEARGREEESESENEDYEDGRRRIGIDEISTLDEDQSITVDTGSMSPSSQIQDLCYDEQPGKDGDNKKSFSHYDLPLQLHTDNSKEEGKKMENIKEEASKYGIEQQMIELAKRGGSEVLLDKKGISRRPKDTADSAPSQSLKIDKAAVDAKSEAKENNQSSYRITSLKETALCESVNTIPLRNNTELNSKPDEVPVINNNKLPLTTTSDIDHEAVLREYLMKPEIKDNLAVQEETTNLFVNQSEKVSPSSPEDYKFIELKIVETAAIPPTEEAFPKVYTVTRERSLTANDVMKSDDDDDVVFIDAGSPPLTRTTFNCDSPIGSVQEVPQCPKEPSKDDTLTLPRAQSISHEEAADQSIVQPLSQLVRENDNRSSLGESSDVSVSLKEENEPQISDKPDDYSTVDEPGKQNALHRLPLRSPTPPKRSPMKSPRIPKAKNNGKEPNSSPALPSNETQELSNGTRSASPTSREKESKFFSFSLRREKSKSSSSLHSKKGKERKRLFTFNVAPENPQVGNPQVNKPATKKDDETNGKRVGKRSMVIDGTIKRNFIVIHPFDESETIGLAPKSQSVSDKDKPVTDTPRALSSVKSHINEISPDKLEAVKRISYQGDLKEELSVVPGQNNESAGSGKNYLNFNRLSRSLRIKNNKPIDHKKLGSSKSLTCDSSASGLSELPSKPAFAMSKVDRHSVSVSSQKIHVKSGSTVSTLCVVM